MISGSAKNAAFNIGKDDNHLNATSKELSNVIITDGDEGAKTRIDAGSIKGTSSITLNSGDSKGNILRVSGAIDIGGATIDMGKGKHELTAGSINNTIIDMSATDGVVQTVRVLSNVTEGTTITTGTGNDDVTILGELRGGSSINIGDDDDTVKVTGKVVNATIDLGDGDDKLTVSNLVDRLTYTSGAGKGDISIAKGVVNSSFNLGTGENSYESKAMTDVSITAANDSTGTHATSVKGGAYSSTQAGNQIKLEGSGANSVELRSISGKTAANILTMTLSAAGGTDTQNVTVNGSMTRVDLTSAGDGDTTIDIASSLGRSTLTLGDGDNTLTVNKNVSTVTYTGGDGKDDITISGATVQNSTFDLKDSANTLTADIAKGGSALTNVDVTVSGTATSDATTVKAGTFKSGVSGNQITLGDGANEVELKSISGTKGSTTTITMGSDAADEQDQILTIKGNVGGLVFSAGKGADTVTINGSVSNSTLALDDGADTFKGSRAPTKSARP